MHLWWLWLFHELKEGVVQELTREGSFGGEGVETGLQEALQLWIQHLRPVCMRVVSVV